MRLPLLVLAATALLATGCGGESEGAPTAETVSGVQTTTPPQTGGDPVAGKKIFTQVANPSCGSCHILEDAGTDGTIGPNLDQAQPDLDLAIDRVTNGKSPMPSYKDQLTEQQIADVAAYVVRATATR